MIQTLVLLCAFYASSSYTNAIFIDKGDPYKVGPLKVGQLTLTKTLHGSPLHTIGLDESVAQYVPLFKVKGVDGRKLLMLNHSDLEKMGINKLGHQELVLEAVDLLRSLRYTLDTENLQSMALQLGCKARNVVAEIQMRQGENDQNRANLRHGELHRKRLSITVLSYVADLLTTLKNLVSWLDRAPFEGIYDICRLRNSVVKLGLELVTVTQRESACVDPEGAIMKSCRTLIEYCDGLVQNTKDPLVIQPAALEQATIRKKHGEELGMNIQSAYNGIHGISSIKDLSPADMCSKIEKGDEVLQVNGQTVLGWQLKELVKILKDKPKEVTLLLKKRPRHINPLGAMQNHKKLAAKHAQQAATLPKSLKKRRSREGEGGKPGRPSLQEFVAVTSSGEDVYVTKDTPDTNDADGNDTDNDVFRSGSESPQYTLPVMPDAKQRRATVSGGSPTLERNSLMVDEPVIRPKSQAMNRAQREATMTVLAASESNLKCKAGGGEEGVPLKGDSVWRKTSSESSSGHKGPSESEMEDSVFSSDKEEKDQQKPKKAAAEKKRHEFRVTKPTPMLLEPTADPPAKSPVRRTSSSSSSTTSSSTLVSSPHSSNRLKAPDILPKPAPHPDTGPKSPDPPVKKSSSAKSPSGKKFTSMFSSRKSSSKSKNGGDSGGKKGSVSEQSVVVKPTAVVDEGSMTSITVSSASTPSPQTSQPVAECMDKNLEGQSADASKNIQKQNSGLFGDDGSEGCVSIEPESRVGKCYKDDGGSKSESTAEKHYIVCVSENTETPTTQSGCGAGGENKHQLVKYMVSGDDQDHWSQSTQQAIYTEVATDFQDRDTPQLMKVKKLDSPEATEVHDPVTENCNMPKQKKRVEFSPDAKDCSPSDSASYIHGGSHQRTAQNAGAEPTTVTMRQKSGSRRVDHRISCKDLGQGDCEGWLYKRRMKDGNLFKHWSKRWCVLKHYNMYHYKNKEELKAEGVIYMPAFEVSPAPDLKTRKFAFKVHNSGTTFYFASERQDDMSKWMNKMGLAAISFDTSHVAITGGFIKPEPRSNHLTVDTTYYNDSEEENAEDGASSHWEGSTPSLVSSPYPSPSTPRRGNAAVPSDPGVTDGGPTVGYTGRGAEGMAQGCGPSQPVATGSVKEDGAPSGDELNSVLRAIHKQDLTIDGVDRRKRRTCHLSSMMVATDGKTDANLAKLRKLLALKRTLKVKEQEVQDIERLLASKPNASRLRDFVYYHPDLKL